MCGIAGLLRRDPLRGDLEACVEAMGRTLRHRGPDSSGAWVDAEAGIALGHRRLAILDLSPAGHQPMASASGRYVISFNGEIYNFRALRDRLRAAGASFAGGSDTEVALAAVEAWGLEGALREFNGMWAIALWDRHERTLALARDRLGEKPLFYGLAGRDVVFASELKALAALPGWTPDIDRQALDHMVRRGYVGAPACIYEGIRKLPPGCWLRMGPGDAAPPAPVAYWSLDETARRGSGATPGERTDELEALLRDAVALRLESDVPVGAFLSGGIDSSLVVALMQQTSASTVRSFAVGFDDRAFDEAPHAAAVAQHLGTEHTEFRVSGDDALALVPELPATYDEPFADPSQIPTMLVSQLASRHVTVALSGDGGDELFAGYRRYRAAERIWRAVGPLPPRARRAAARALAAPEASTWRRVEARGRRLGLPVPARLPERVGKAAGALGASSPRDLHLRMMAQWPASDALVLGAQADRPTTRAVPGLSDLDAMLLEDGTSYLPDDILVKLDRASMRVGLECRVPLLDHRVVEHAWSTPAGVKVVDGVGKAPLRAVLRRHVPEHLTDRPKQGFDVPLAAWLRGPLRSWADDLLSPERLSAQGLLHPAPIAARWQEHVAGRRDHHLSLWNVLMVQSWLESHTALPSPEPEGRPCERS